MQPQETGTHKKLLLLSIENERLAMAFLLRNQQVQGLQEQLQKEKEQNTLEVQRIKEESLQHVEGLQRRLTQIDDERTQNSQLEARIEQLQVQLQEKEVKVICLEQRLKEQQEGVGGAEQQKVPQGLEEQQKVSQGLEDKHLEELQQQIQQQNKQIHKQNAQFYQQKQVYDDLISKMQGQLDKQSTVIKAKAKEQPEYKGTLLLKVEIQRLWAIIDDLQRQLRAEEKQREMRSQGGSMQQSQYLLETIDDLRRQQYTQQQMLMQQMQQLSQQHSHLQMTMRLSQSQSRTPPMSKPQQQNHYINFGDISVIRQGRSAQL